jgi:3-keto-disaccharide hydrolase
MDWSASMNQRVIMMITACCLTGILQANPQSANHQSNHQSANQQSPNKSAIRNPQSAMRVLFDGKSLDAWRGYKTDKAPDGWRIENGTLTKNTPVADIVSKDEFGDFELEIEWKIGEGGNSGVFYRGTEEYDHIYWSAPEYQLLDDEKAADNKTRLTCAGAAYALYPSPPGHLKPVGQWNTTRIVAKGAHVEHWLNGVKLLEYELWSPDWEAKVKASKFKDYPNYGRAKRGHIALQGDHAGALAFRNIRIREM